MPNLLTLSRCRSSPTFFLLSTLKHWVLILRNTHLITRSQFSISSNYLIVSYFLGPPCVCWVRPPSRPRKTCPVSAVVPVRPTLPFSVFQYQLHKILPTFVPVFLNFGKILNYLLKNRNPIFVCAKMFTFIT